MSNPLTKGRVLSLARSAVDKIDGQGQRGITLCSVQEIEALAMVALMSGLLKRPVRRADANETPMFKSRRAR